jgi:hypothetical protein
MKLTAVTSRTRTENSEIEEREKIVCASFKKDKHEQ